MSGRNEDDDLALLLAMVEEQPSGPQGQQTTALPDGNDAVEGSGCPALDAPHALGRNEVSVPQHSTRGDPFRRTGAGNTVEIKRKEPSPAGVPAERGPNRARAFGSIAESKSAKMDTAPRELFAGFSVSKPLVSSFLVKEKFEEFPYLPIHSLFSGLYTAAPDARFGTAGVIVRKLPPKETRSGRAFSVWKLQGPNAAAHQQPVTLMLFGNAHNALWQTERGQVLVLLGPKSKDDGSGMLLSVDDPGQVIIAGRSSDFVLCSGRLETGDACPELVDKRTAIEGLCDHHLQLRAKLLAKRKPTSTGAQSSVFFGRFREDQNRHLASQVSQSDRALATSLAAARKRSAGGGVGEQQRAAQKARLSLDVDEEKDAVHAGDPTLTALLSKLPGGIPAPNPNRPRTALEKKAREELRAARKTAAGGEGQRASAGGDASGDASASGSPVPRARGGAEGGKGGDVRQPRAGPRFRLSDVLEREEKPLAVAECGPEGHALDRGKMGPRKDGRSVLGPGGHGGASGDAKRSAFAEKFGGVVGLGDGAASGSKRESQYRGVAEAERRAESMKRITEAAIKERAAELRSGRQDAAGTLTKRICKTCRGKAIPPGLSAAQVLALHRGHKIVKETKKAFEFTCELQGCGYRQTGWMTDVITCKRCQARCKVVLGDSGDPLSRMRLGDLRRLGMPR